ncbi:hypothetical protein F4680DRAFT_432847 [Xylaria scruposa]|nr:hypothetical protein F4680DRAFT_432847 [Xylaria scruposa]
MLPAPFLIISPLCLTYILTAGAVYTTTYQLFYSSILYTFNVGLRFRLLLLLSYDSTRGLRQVKYKKLTKKKRS